MDERWGHSERIEAVNTAIYNLPHDQIPVGLGFRLRHDPTKCRRCRANIAILELASIIRHLESEFLNIGLEGETTIEQATGGVELDT